MEAYSNPVFECVQHEKSACEDVSESKNGYNLAQLWIFIMSLRVQAK